MDIQGWIESLGSSLNKEQIKPIVGIAAATTVALYTTYALRKKRDAIPEGFRDIPTVSEGRIPYFGKDHKHCHTSCVTKNKHVYRSFIVNG